MAAPAIGKAAWPAFFPDHYLWSVLTLATFVYGAFYIGRLLFRGRQHPAVSSLVGGLILIVALQIPWLNILVWTAMVCFGLGAQLLEFHRQRPWAAKTDAGDGPPPPPAAQPQDVAAQDSIADDLGATARS